MSKLSLTLAIGIMAVLGGCGGGGDTTTSTTPSFTVPAHSTPSTPLTEDNLQFVMANAQAIAHVFRYWIQEANSTIKYVKPEQTTLGFLCGGGGQVDVRYADLDGDRKISKGDQIVSDSALCQISPLGGGRVTFTALAADASGITDMRVNASGTVESWSLAAYGWAHRLSGTMRFVYTDSQTIVVLGEGDIELALEGGAMLKLRNLALTYKLPLGSTSGQFDLVFASGQQAGTVVQVDTIGEISEWGSNVGPEPGALQLSGLAGTKARLQGRFVDGVGARFKTLADFTGKGDLTEWTDVSDQEFYGWFRQ